MSPKPWPKYALKVLQYARTLSTKPGEIQHVTVLHDAWCSQLLGIGDCDCDPVIKPGSGHTTMWQTVNQRT